MSLKQHCCNLRFYNSSLVPQLLVQQSVYSHKLDLHEMSTFPFFLSILEKKLGNICCRSCKKAYIALFRFSVIYVLSKSVGTVRLFNFKLLLRTPDIQYFSPLIYCDIVQINKVLIMKSFLQFTCWLKYAYNAIYIVASDACSVYTINF